MPINNHDLLPNQMSISEKRGRYYQANSNDPSLYRDRLLGRVQGSAQDLYVTSISSTNLIATENNRSEGNLFIKTNGVPPVYMNTESTWTPVHGSRIFTEYQKNPESTFENVRLSPESQRLLRESGVLVFDGNRIPENPTTDMDTGVKRFRAGIHSDGIFSQVQTDREHWDERYIVTSRVPDDYNYHYERHKYDSTIRNEEKGHAQFERPASYMNSNFEQELAKVRYLSGMEPYLDDHQAKLFDHFTYRKTKQPNISNAFRGAYVHIFISRPDLHIFDRTKDSRSLRADIMNHPDLASMIYLNPEGAISLVGKWQTGAMTDLNLFLSNRAVGCSIGNDQIDDHSFVEAFTKIKPGYGGRMDNPEGDIDITFNETQDLSVSNTILLWMKYIHATYTGEISPLVSSTSRIRNQFEAHMKHHHPLWRRLDSLASIYIVATDMTQRNVIFWRKYFGVYPKNTPYSGLGPSGDGKVVETVRKITIPFRYVTFRTNNIVDLYAFNRLTHLDMVLGQPGVSFRNTPYQTFDTTNVTDYEIISGLPFIATEQHIDASFPFYIKDFPTRMINPQLLFTRSDNGFIPNDLDRFNREYVQKYWSGLGNG